MYLLFSFQAMTKVYSKCYQEIGAFNDTRYIIGMLEKVMPKNLLQFLYFCSY